MQLFSVQYVCEVQASHQAKKQWPVFSTLSLIVT